MPYDSNDKLPESIKNSLPAKAQDIWRAAFNNAYDGDDESTVKIAWGAVKSAGYKKDRDGNWVLAKSLVTIADSDAPGYRPADGDDSCESCITMSCGECERYNFPVLKDWTCNCHARENMDILKIDEDRRLVFGFFNVNKIGKDEIFDLQDDSISTEELEQAVYDYVLNARIAGDSHVRKGVGTLVESLIFSAEKQKAIVDCLKAQGIEARIELGVEGWFGGFYIEDEEVWKAIKSGEYSAFSIGGKALREKVEDED